jgi:hypothetical protein
MTWEEILTLDNAALNLAIEWYCTTHQWHVERIPDVGREAWVLEHADIEWRLYSSEPSLHHTASWDCCMALAWKYRISIWCSQGLPGVRWAWCVALLGGHEDGSWGTTVMTEAEARRAICQLALWQAIQAFQRHL